MNKIYKVIWSEVKKCYIVVSEFSKSVARGKSKQIKALALAAIVGMGVAVSNGVNVYAAGGECADEDHIHVKMTAEAATKADAIAAIEKAMKAADAAIEEEIRANKKAVTKAAMAAAAVADEIEKNAIGAPKIGNAIAGAVDVVDNAVNAVFGCSVAYAEEPLSPEERAEAAAAAAKSSAEEAGAAKEAAVEAKVLAESAQTAAETAAGTAAGKAEAAADSATVAETAANTATNKAGEAATSADKAAAAATDAVNAKIGTLPEKVGDTPTATVVDYIDAKAAVNEAAATTAKTAADNAQITATENAGKISELLNAIGQDTAPNSLKGRLKTLETTSIKGVTVNGVNAPSDNGIIAITDVASKSALETLSGVVGKAASEEGEATGLVKDVADLQVAVGGESTGLVHDVAVLKGEDTVDGSVAKTVKDKIYQVVGAKETAAEGTVYGAIKAEEDARKAQIGELGKVSEEAGAADQTVKGYVDAKAAANEALISAEETARKEQIGDLGKQALAEGESVAKDHTVKSYVDAAISTVTGNADKLADLVGGTELTDGGKTVLQRLDTLEGEDTVDGSVAKSIKDKIGDLGKVGETDVDHTVKSYVDATVSELDAKAIKEISVNGEIQTVTNNKVEITDVASAELLGTADDRKDKSTAFGKIAAEADRAKTVEGEIKATIKDITYTEPITPETVGTTNVAGNLKVGDDTANVTIQGGSLSTTGTATFGIDSAKKVVVNGTTESAPVLDVTGDAKVTGNLAATGTSTFGTTDASKVIINAEGEGASTLDVKGTASVSGQFKVGAGATIESNGNAKFGNISLNAVANDDQGIVANTISGLSNTTLPSGDYSGSNKAATEAQVYAVANSQITFKGDSATTVEKKVGETLNIVGSATGELTTNNIGVNVVNAGTEDAPDYKIKVQLAKNVDLTNAGSLTIGTVAGSVLTGSQINNTGLTVAGKDSDENSISSKIESTGLTVAGADSKKTTIEAGTATFTGADGKRVSVNGTNALDVTGTANITGTTTVGSGEKQVVLNGTSNALAVTGAASITGTTTVGSGEKQVVLNGTNALAVTGDASVSGATTFGTATTKQVVINGAGTNVLEVAGNANVSNTLTVGADKIQLKNDGTASFGYGDVGSSAIKINETAGKISGLSNVAWDDAAKNDTNNHIAATQGQIKDALSQMTNAGWGLTSDQTEEKEVEGETVPVEVQQQLGKSLAITGDKNIATKIVKSEGNKGVQVTLKEIINLGTNGTDENSPAMITINGEEGTITAGDKLSLNGVTGDAVIGAISYVAGKEAVVGSGTPGELGYVAPADAVEEKTTINSKLDVTGDVNINDRIQLKHDGSILAENTDATKDKDTGVTTGTVYKLQLDNNGISLSENNMTITPDAGDGDPTVETIPLASMTVKDGAVTSVAGENKVVVAADGVTTTAGSSVVTNTDGTTFTSKIVTTGEGEGAVTIPATTTKINGADVTIGDNVRFDGTTGDAKIGNITFNVAKAAVEADPGNSIDASPATNNSISGLNSIVGEYLYFGRNAAVVGDGTTEADEKNARENAIVFRDTIGADGNPYRLIGGLTNTKWDPTRIGDNKDVAATQGQLYDIATQGIIINDDNNAFTNIPLSDNFWINGDSKNIYTSINTDEGKKSIQISIDDNPVFDSVKTTARIPVVDEQGNPVKDAYTIKQTEMSPASIVIKESGKQDVILTSSGLNNGHNKITNVVGGTSEGEVVTWEQLEAEKVTFGGANPSINVTLDQEYSLTNKGKKYLIGFNDHNTTYTVDNSLAMTVVQEGKEAGKDSEFQNAIYKLSVKADDSVFTSTADKGLTLKSVFTLTGTNSVTVDSNSGTIYGLTNHSMTETLLNYVGESTIPDAIATTAATQGQLLNVMSNGFVVQGDDSNTYKQILGGTLNVKGGTFTHTIGQDKYTTNQNIETMATNDGLKIGIVPDPVFRTAKAWAMYVTDYNSVGSAFVKNDALNPYTTSLSSTSTRVATERQLYEIIQNAKATDIHITSGELHGTLLKLHSDNQPVIDIELEGLAKEVISLKDQSALVMHTYDESNNYGAWGVKELHKADDGTITPGDVYDNTTLAANEVTVKINNVPTKVKSHEEDYTGANAYAVIKSSPTTTTAGKVYGINYHVMDTAGNDVEIEGIAKADVVAEIDGRVIQHQIDINKINNGFNAKVADNDHIQIIPGNGQTIHYTVNQNDNISETNKNPLVIKQNYDNGVLDVDITLNPNGSYSTLSVGKTSAKVELNSNGIYYNDLQYLGKDGLNMNNKPITGLGEGEIAKDSTDAITGAQFEPVYSAVNSGIKVQGQTGDQLVMNLTDEDTRQLNILVSGKNIYSNSSLVDGIPTVTVSMAATPTFDGLTVAGVTINEGSYGTINHLSNTTWNADGTPTSGRAATEEQVADVIDLLEAKGTNYIVDVGSDAHTDLGGNLTLKGGAKTNLTEGNIGVVSDGSDKLTIKLSENVTLGKTGSLNVGDNEVGNSTLSGASLVVTNNSAAGTNAIKATYANTGTTIETAQGKTQIDYNGLTVIPTDSNVKQQLSFNKTLISAGSQQITNVKTGISETTSLEYKPESTGLYAITDDNNAATIGDVKAMHTKVETVEGNSNIIVTRPTADNALQQRFIVELNDKISVSNVIFTNPGQGEGTETTSTLSTRPQGSDVNGNEIARLDYVYKIGEHDPVTATIATLNDGINFSGDRGSTIPVALNDKSNNLSIKGGADVSALLTDKNIAVIASSDTIGDKTQHILDIKLAKHINLKDNNVEEDKGGTITGLSNTSWNVAEAESLYKNSAQAATEGQLYALLDSFDGGWGLKADSAIDPKFADGIKQDLGKTLNISGDAKNISTIANSEGIRVALSDQVVLGGTANGSLNIKNSSNEARIALDADSTHGVLSLYNVTDEDTFVAKVYSKKDGDDIRLSYNNGETGDKLKEHTLATLNDGIVYAGDNLDAKNENVTLGAALNHQVNIKGGISDAAKLTDNNIGVVVNKDTNTLFVKLGKNLNLTDGGTINFGVGTTSAPVTNIDKTGLTLSNGAKFTTTSVDAGNNVIERVASGFGLTATGGAAIVDKAANIQDVISKSNEVINKGWGLIDGDNSSVKADVGEKLHIFGDSTDGIDDTPDNIITKVVNTEGKKGIKISLSDKIELGSAPTATTPQDKRLTLSGQDGVIAIGDAANTPVVKFGYTGNGNVGGVTFNNNQGTDGVYTTSTITGLTNQSWSGTTDNTGRAATEGQLTNLALAYKVNTGSVQSTLLSNGLNFVNGSNTEAALDTSGNIKFDLAKEIDLTSIGSLKFGTASGNTYTSIDATSISSGITTIGTTGLTVKTNVAGASDVTITNTGISAGEQQITNVASGADTNGKYTINNNAATILDVKNLSTQVTAGKNILVEPGSSADNGANTQVVKLKNDVVLGGFETEGATAGPKGSLTIKDANNVQRVALGVDDSNNGTIKLSSTTNSAEATISVAKESTTGAFDRITYKDSATTPKTHTVATVEDDGLTFAGDSGSVNKKLNTTITIKGGETDSAKLTNGNNIGVVADGSTLTVKLAESVNLGASGRLMFGTATGALVIDGANKNITGLESGIVKNSEEDNKNAANIGDVKALSTTLEAGNTNIVVNPNSKTAANGGKVASVALANDISLTSVVTAKTTMNSSGITVKNASDTITTKIEDGKVTIGTGTGNVEIDGTGNGHIGAITFTNTGTGDNVVRTVSRLSNTEWKKDDTSQTNYRSSSNAATEAQLKAVYDSISSSVSDGTWTITDGGTTDSDKITRKLGKSIAIVGDAVTSGGTTTGNVITDVEGAGEDAKLKIKLNDVVTIGSTNAVTINGNAGTIGLVGTGSAKADIIVVKTASSSDSISDRIRYVDSAYKPHELATLEDGFKLYGDLTYEGVQTHFNDSIKIVSDKTGDNDSTRNISVKLNSTGTDHVFYVKLNDKIDLGSTGEVKAGSETQSFAVDKTGLTVTSETFKTEYKGTGLTITVPTDTNQAGTEATNLSFTKDRVSVGGLQIKNVGSGITAGTTGNLETDNTNAANIGDVKQLLANVTAGLTTEVVTGNNTNVAKSVGSDKTTYTVNLNDQITLGSATTSGSVSLMAANARTGDVAKVVLDVNAEKGGMLSLAGASNAKADIYVVKPSEGFDRITYADSTSTADKPSVHTVATLDDGLTFAGDKGNVTSALNGTVTIKGGQEDASKLSDDNIGVVSVKEGIGADEKTYLAVKLAEDINLTSVTTGSTSISDNGLKIKDNSENVLVSISKDGSASFASDSVKIATDGKTTFGNVAVMDATGLTIGTAAYAPKFTNAGISAGNQQISNVKSGIGTTPSSADDSNAANIGDVKKMSTKVEAGTNIKLVDGTTANGITAKQITLNDNITLGTIDTKQVNIDGTTASATFGTGANGVKIDGSNASATFGSGTSAVVIDGAQKVITGLTSTNYKTADNIAANTYQAGQAATEDQLHAIVDGTTENAGGGWGLKAQQDSSGGTINTTIKKNIGGVLDITGDENITTKLTNTGVKVDLNDIVTLGTEEAKKIKLDGTAGTINVGTTGNKTVINKGTVEISGTTDNAIKFESTTAGGSVATFSNKNGDAATTTTTITGAKILAGNIKVNNESGESTITGLTNIEPLAIMTDADKILGRAATEAQVYAVKTQADDLATKITSQKIAYSANSTVTNPTTPKEVQLSKGLNFVNGTNTTASVGADGIVTFSLNDTVTLGTDAQKSELKNTGLVVSKTTSTGIGEDAKTTVTSATYKETGVIVSRKVGEDAPVNMIELKDDGTAKFAGGKVAIDTTGKTTFGTSAAQTEIDGATVKVGSITVNGSSKEISGLNNLSIDSLTDTSSKAATEGQLFKVNAKVTSNTNAIETNAQAISTNTGNITANTNAIAEINAGYIKTVAKGDNNKLTITPNTGTTIEYNDQYVKAGNYTATGSSVSLTSVDANGVEHADVVINGLVTSDAVLTYGAGSTTKTVGTGEGKVASLIFANGTNTTASINDTGEVVVSLNDTITGLTSATFGSDTTVSNNGLVIGTGTNAPKFTKSGISAGRQQITNVASGITLNSGETTNDTHAANMADVKALRTVVTSGSTGVTVTPNPTTDIGGQMTYSVGLANTVVIGRDTTKQVTIDGANGKFAIGGNKVVLNNDGSGNIGSVNFVSSTVTGTNGPETKTNITGLSNTGWGEGYSVMASRAATEGQLEKVASEATKHSTVSQGDNIVVTPSTTNGVNDYKVALNPAIKVNSVQVGADNNNAKIVLNAAATDNNIADFGGVKINSTGNAANDTRTISGLSNTTWNGSPESGRAATENQLASVQTTLNNTITAEKSRAEGVESGLDARITANKNAIDLLNNADDTVVGSVAYAVKAEETRATGVENSLQAAIDKLNSSATTEGSVAHAVKAEETRATGVENSLQAAIDKLNSSATTEGSVKKAVADVKASGMNFTGDTGDVHRDLGTTLKVAGGVTDATKLTSGNIGVVASSDNSVLTVSLAKDIAINSVTAANSVAVGTAVGGKYPILLSNDGSASFANEIVKVSADGLNIAGGKVVLNSDGNGNIGGAKFTSETVTENNVLVPKTTITGLTNTKWDPNHYVSGRAATEDQLKDVIITATGGWGLTSDEPNTTGGYTSVKQALGGTLFIRGAEVDGHKNIYTSIKADEGVIINLSKDLVLDNVLLNSALKFASGSSGTGSVGNVKLDNSGLNAGKIFVNANKNVITGLDNTTWDSSKVTAGSNQAATEGQMLGLATELNEKLEKAIKDISNTTVSAGKNIDVTSTDKNGTVNYEVALKDKVTLGNITVNDDGKITGVADGVNPKDAVNVSQLKDVEKKLGSIDPSGEHGNLDPNKTLVENVVNIDNKVGDIAKVKDGYYIDKQQSLADNIKNLDDAMGKDEEARNYINRDKDGTPKPLTLSENVKALDDAMGKVKAGFVVNTDETNPNKESDKVKSLTLADNINKIDDYGVFYDSKDKDTISFKNNGNKDVTINKVNGIDSETSSAAGNHSIVIGATKSQAGTEATHDYNAVIGSSEAKVEGSYSMVAASDPVHADGHFNVIVGSKGDLNGTNYTTEAIGKHNTIVGSKDSSAYGNHATIIGSENSTVGKKGETDKGNHATVIGGNGAKAEGNYSVAIGGNAQAVLDNSFALGSGAKAEKVHDEDNLAKIGYAGTKNAEKKQVVKVVSVGGGENASGEKVYRQIQGVAAGEISAESTDAVNGSQLHATHEAINNLAGAASNAIDGLNQQMKAGFNQVNGRVNAAGANAAALAALHPVADNDSKLSFATGVGSYHGAKATALGAFYKPDENIQFSISGTSGHGEHMYNMGISVALDKVAGTIPTKKKLMQEVDMLNAKLSESEERIAALEKMVMELAKTLNNK